MVDDKTKQDFRDRNKVAGDQDYEVEYFAREHGITPAQVRDLIHTYGSDRARLADAARELRTKDG